MARLSAALSASKGDQIAIIDDEESVTWRAYRQGPPAPTATTSSPTTRNSPR